MATLSKIEREGIAMAILADAKRLRRAVFLGLEESVKDEIQMLRVYLDRLVKEA